MCTCFQVNEKTRGKEGLVLCPLLNRVDEATIFNPVTSYHQSIPFILIQPFSSLIPYHTIDRLEDFHNQQRLRSSSILVPDISDHFRSYQLHCSYSITHWSCPIQSNPIQSTRLDSNLSSQAHKLRSGHPDGWGEDGREERKRQRVEKEATKEGKIINQKTERKKARTKSVWHHNQHDTRSPMVTWSPVFILLIWSRVLRWFVPNSKFSNPPSPLPSLLPWV